MAKNDLKKLGRTDLLRLLLEAEEENDRLKEQVAELQSTTGASRKTPPSPIPWAA